MNRLTFITLLSLLMMTTFGLYSSGSPVTQLTSKDFDKVYKGIWLV